MLCWLLSKDADAVFCDKRWDDLVGKDWRKRGKDHCEELVQNAESLDLLEFFSEAEGNFLNGTMVHPSEWKPADARHVGVEASRRAVSLEGGNMLTVLQELQGA